MVKIVRFHPTTKDRWPSRSLFVEVFHRQETRIVDIYETQEEIDAQTQPQLDVDIDLNENTRKG